MCWAAAVVGQGKSLSTVIWIFVGTIAEAAETLRKGSLKIFEIVREIAVNIIK